METCNVNCRFYIWDKITEPDSKKSTPLAETSLGCALKSIGIDLNTIFPEHKDVLSGVDLEKEYKLIQDKKSKLPSALRLKVVRRFERLQHEQVN